MGKFNEKTKLREVLNDERAVSIIKKYFGENVLKNPMVGMAKVMSIGKAITYKNQIGLNDEKIDKLIEEVMNLE